MSSLILPELALFTASAFDAATLTLLAEEAIAQDLASSMTDGLVLARHKIEMMVSQQLNAAWSKAIDAHITPRPIEQIAAEQRSLDEFLNGRAA